MARADFFVFDSFLEMCYYITKYQLLKKVTHEKR